MTISDREVEARFAPPGRLLTRKETLQERAEKKVRGKGFLLPESAFLADFAALPSPSFALPTDEDGMCWARSYLVAK